ncbi:hypothetical protein CK215_15725 [Mesorhizobium sp. WSM3864]|uniref:HEPN domain-containing protein n=1 Tax=Mesorhizobium sp. WSM3864 TaxID=2029404 RepID=UPI000BAE9E2D|nr:HEPN domain-containing protein [Mesorhizobium sp. WSM3864]PBB91708.1 hypothetical protein CK215_15725 [Mesorhizobium sp. WSM3864]
MDIRAILNRKLGELPEGAHTNGLRAVKRHVDAAVKHLERGQSEPDETLYNDAIYRCNQAFEGSIKEAYRVLAGRDPEGKSIHEIEQFLSQGNHLRRKVLDQFTRYRQEWRNPSTHDYTLDFDEDEALLATVSVTAFAIVLCDQIAGQLAYLLAAAAEPEQTSPEDRRGPLLELVTQRALSFVQNHEEAPVVARDDDRARFQHAYEFEGALRGFLSAELAADGEIEVDAGTTFATGAAVMPSEADIVVTRGGERVVLELKRSQGRNVGNATDAALAKVLRLMQHPHVSGAVIVIYNGSGVEYGATPANSPLDEQVRIIAPKRSRPGS